MVSLKVSSSLTVALLLVALTRVTLNLIFKVTVYSNEFSPSSLYIFPKIQSHRIP
jgi:hypothetical protein